MKKSFYLLIISIFSFIGCTGSPNISSDFVVDYKQKVKEDFKNEVYKNYNINREKTVYVGNEIVENSSLKRYCKDVFIIKYKASMDYKKIIKNKLYEIQGYSKKDNSINYVFVFSENGYFRYLKLDNNGNLKSRSLYDSSGKILISDYIQNDNLKFEAIKLKDEIKSYSKFLDGSFKYQLIYSGRDGNNIKIAYREFLNDMARAAFYQNLTYNLNESTIIRYKNIKIKVLEATNESIKYIVLEE
ncbi:hypothetical protein B0F89_12626 [Malaciobacter marinus]|mgnify:CR=1 FL=1|jgi:hypothetical protein|uniref:Lipoprotein n=1 Tax=Malaciobacter marinus TaxID=505249 RepID=A0AB36ZTW3_9BACT|nr:hypothetical protein [Malaciobacter marinus]PPK60240.1 hypothetical protein B0F89_12626 [Malaciobacter marinus]